MTSQNKKRYKAPKISSQKIKRDYFFTNQQWFPGSWDIIYLAAKSGKSDFQLKKNIRPIRSEDILDKLQKIRVVSFNWNDNAKKYGIFSNEQKTGLIAQEVEELFPELVSHDSSHIKEIDYGKFAGLIILAIQKLHSQNIQLKLRMDRLESLMNEKIN